MYVGVSCLTLVVLLLRCHIYVVPCMIAVGVGRSRHDKGNRYGRQFFHLLPASGCVSIPEPVSILNRSLHRKVSIPQTHRSFKLYCKAPQKESEPKCEPLSDSLRRSIYLSLSIFNGLPLWLDSLTGETMGEHCLTRDWQEVAGAPLLPFHHASVFSELRFHWCPLRRNTMFIWHLLQGCSQLPLGGSSELVSVSIGERSISRWPMLHPLIITLQRCRNRKSKPSDGFTFKLKGQGSD